MNIRILSDLHLEFGDFELPDTDVDVVVLAGDIHVKHRGLAWALRAFPTTPVVYVLGNHEYYGCAIPKHTQKMMAEASATHVHVLENSMAVLNGVRFLGCTLWTDFCLYGDPRIAGFACTERMTDFRKIRVSPLYRRFRSLDAATTHARSRNWLAGVFAERSIPTVVVTHHAPSRRSLGRVSGEDLTDAAYASDLDSLVEDSGAAVWIHGHVHRSVDYLVGSTRVVCNPRGYPDELNPDFAPELSVEIETNA